MSIKADSKNAQLSDTELKAMVDKQMAEKLKKANEVLAQVQNNQSEFAKIAKENCFMP